MKLFSFFLMLTIGLLFSTTYATETLSEKGRAVSKDIERDANKSINRVEEATCTGTDTECAKRRIENRAEEGKDLVKDKSSEMKDKVD
ncbi:hypothetical protein [Nitrosomonas sp. Nm166]|uniref:hypothetical protein n=1 Tax=Nitrosomonas sp. Nm166 TaxID=1881054 RepID=UPI0008EF011D|nr:hypothetical protein [Nitrosomonas sp. Nm166]SFF09194.1 hypothetical protein SAMN05428977_10494 [Nitrosomonas sp. Nm166]